MKRALCLFTFAAALSTSAFAAPLTPAAPACPADAAAAVFAADAGANAAKKPKCPREGILCPAIYDPVICSDGQVYSNSCYANVACATGCVPYNEAI